MKTAASILVLLLFSLCSRAGEMEDTYLKEKCLPLVRTFLRTNGVPFPSDFPTNSISHWRVHFEKESGAYLSRLMLIKRYAFMFIGNKTTNGITYFYDKASPWSSRLLDAKNEREMRELAAQTNLLNQSTALALLRNYFRQQGHDERNFHPVRYKQVSWASDVPSRRISLPFYEAEWARRDVKLPIEDNESIYPSVTIIVSGLSSNLVAYSKISLPIEHGADWEPGHISEKKRHP